MVSVLVVKVLRNSSGVKACPLLRGPRGQKVGLEALTHVWCSLHEELCFGGRGISDTETSDEGCEALQGVLIGGILSPDAAVNALLRVIRWLIF
jgi:hypothetical protein